jgi:hypothetical protein
MFRIFRFSMFVSFRPKKLLSNPLAEGHYSRPMSPNNRAGRSGFPRQSRPRGRTRNEGEPTTSYTFAERPRRKRPAKVLAPDEAQPELPRRLGNPFGRSPGARVETRSERPTRCCMKFGQLFSHWGGLASSVLLFFLIFSLQQERQYAKGSLLE